MVCPACISAAIVANAPAIGAALGGVAVGSRFAFPKPRLSMRAAPRPPAGSRAAAEQKTKPRAAPPPDKPPSVVFYSSFPERDD
jgi:hypothetical protein